MANFLPKLSGLVAHFRLRARRLCSTLEFLKSYCINSIRATYFVGVFGAPGHSRVPMLTRLSIACTGYACGYG
jgi:hypothetical protein